MGGGAAGSVTCWLLWRLIICRILTMQVQVLTLCLSFGLFAQVKFVLVLFLILTFMCSLCSFAAPARWNLSFIARINVFETWAAGSSMLGRPQRAMKCLLPFSCTLTLDNFSAVSVYVHMFLCVFHIILPCMFLAVAPLLLRACCFILKSWRILHFLNSYSLPLGAYIINLIIWRFRGMYLLRSWMNFADLCISLYKNCNMLQILLNVHFSCFLCLCCCPAIPSL